MTTLYVIVCDSTEEAEIAKAWFAKGDFKNIQVKQYDECKYYEIEGSAPNFSFAQRFGRMSDHLFEVRAEK
ncbi:hypothetical protein [Methylomonas rosea]|uniref:Uncharacterized protein n=1 Tax=Methylomonas rosea TaxID=2952227 RepID=A0ABT1TQ46_9GAMM|nr:hypothetical protein [Methylomonas sp. WSC-7]MCQ8116670.1 hypothetical protein [Methylomonas sp. WSC-7]